jgi:hypothetical protein
MTTRYQIFETLKILYQVVIKLFTNIFFSPWEQVKPKFDQNFISSKHQLPVGRHGVFGYPKTDRTTVSVGSVLK